MIVFSGNQIDSWSDLVLPIDKPKGMTSFDVIRFLRRTIGVRKIGHAGTLDPMATGLLICLVGRSTRRMREYLEMSKVYSGVMKLGEVTPSYDADTEVSEVRPVEHIRTADIQEARERFVGTFVQETPMYSAVKVGGERLYRKARKGERVKTPPRVVSVLDFTLGSLQDQELPFSITCSKGTYIRSIAHAFGQQLGVGAHLIALRRERIGELSVDDAWSLDQVAASQEKSKTYAFQENSN